MPKSPITALFALLISFSTTANAGELYSEEEATWRHTEIGFIWLDNAFKVNYCAKEVRFYLGCIAGLEQIAKLNDIKSEVIVDQTSLRIVKNPQFTEPESPADVKKFYHKQRDRYKYFESTFNKVHAEEIEKVYSEQKNKLKNIEPFQVARVLNAIENVVYDIHTQYKPASRYNGARVSSKNAIVGIRYSRENEILSVLSVVKGLPAELAGIKSGDKINAMNNQNIKDLTDDQIDKIMTKKIKETVNLSLTRNATEFKAKIAFVEAAIPDSVQRQLSFAQKKYAYLHFENFMNENLCQTVKEFLQKAQTLSAGAIIDLRGNGGGLTEQAACILGALIGEKEVMMYEKNLIDSQITHVETAGSKIFNKPLVVLTNHSSASASEVLSGSLQVYGRALVIGTQTFGKGTQQVPSELGRLIRLETAFFYYLANGQSPQLVGVTPDIKTFVNPAALEFETSILREGDLGIRPLPVTPIEVKLPDIQKLETPSHCISQKNVLGLYEKLAVNNWQKDLQLLTGLAALSCLKK